MPETGQEEILDIGGVATEFSIKVDAAVREATGLHNNPS